MSNIEEQIKREPVHAIMTLIMRLCNDEQKQVIYEKLGRRVKTESPDPATEEALKAEAEMRYPQTAYELDTWSNESIINLERAAYLEGRRKNISRIKELEERLSRITMERDSLADELAVYKLEK